MLYKKETTELYTRSASIVINNQLGEAPSVTFHEQLATTDGQVVEGRVGGCHLTLEDPAGTFPLLHPETGAEIGELSYTELQVALFSLYIKAATERDALDEAILNQQLEVEVEEEATDGSAE